MRKSKKCKVCGADISDSIFLCPVCGEKIRKPFYKSEWFIMVSIVTIVSIIIFI